jgi:hypothetical protein
MSVEEASPGYESSQGSRLVCTDAPLNHSHRSAKLDRQLAQAYTPLPVGLRDSLTRLRSQKDARGAAYM